MRLEQEQSSADSTRIYCGRRQLKEGGDKGRWVGFEERAKLSRYPVQKHLKYHIISHHISFIIRCGNSLQTEPETFWAVPFGNTTVPPLHSNLVSCFQLLLLIFTLLQWLPPLLISRSLWLPRTSVPRYVLPVLLFCWVNWI